MSFLNILEKSEVGRNKTNGINVVTKPDVVIRWMENLSGEDETLTSKPKVDLARLPPCHPALKPHLQRVNHRVVLYKRADESILEKPNPSDDGQVWIRIEDGVLAGVVPRFCVTKLTGWSPGHWWSWRGRRGGGGKRGRTSLTLTISVKAMVNDDLTLIVWSPWEVEARHLRNYHSGLLFTWISKRVGKWT